VLKSRLAHTTVDEKTGDVKIVPALPPRLPKATPAAIRHYLSNPPNYSKLSAQERAPEKELTDDDRAAVKLATAEAEAEAERLRRERVERQARAEERRTNRPAPQPAGPVESAPAQANGAAAKQEEPEPGKATHQQLARLAELRSEVFGLIGLNGHREE